MPRLTLHIGWQVEVPAWVEVCAENRGRMSFCKKLSDQCEGQVQEPECSSSSSSPLGPGPCQHPARRPGDELCEPGDDSPACTHHSPS